MSIFDHLSRLLKKSAPGIAALEKAEADAQAALDAAKAKLSALAASRVEAVLGGDDARAAHRAAIQIGRDDEEDAQAALLAVQARLAQERDVAAQAARVAAYDAARDKRNAAAEVIRERYPQLAAGLVDLLRLAAEANAATEAANADLPSGARPLDDAESAVRDALSVPRELVSKRRVSLWCTAGSKLPVEDQKGIIDDGEGRGRKTFPATGARGTTTSHYDKHEFIEQRWREGRPAAFGPRLAALDLPGLVAGEPDFWSASSWSSPEGILLKITDAKALRGAYRAAAPEPAGIVTEYELVGDLAPEAAE